MPPHGRTRIFALAAIFALRARSTKKPIHDVGSVPSFAAQYTKDCIAENRPFAALVANVSVADKPA
jgi:hypothetical protein